MSNITYSTQKTGVTKDYSVFQYFDRNRIVSKTNVEKLRQDMALNTQKDEVVVNEKWQVIDGQHRIAALEKDKKPVKFRVKPGANMQDVIAANNTGTKWNTPAWVRNFSHPDHVNNKPYVMYIEFKEKHKLCDGVCQLLLSEDFHDYGRKSFKNGTFKVKNLGRAEENAAALAELVAVDKMFNSMRCAVGFLKIQKLPHFKLTILKTQVEKHCNKITHRVTHSDWVDGLIRVYNFNLKAPAKRIRNSII
tara:strand:- start:90 stop:836 length:747 start_codon:yes stop_codon:yes gene_type:complete